MIRQDDQEERTVKTIEVPNIRLEATGVEDRQIIVEPDERRGHRQSPPVGHRDVGGPADESITNTAIARADGAIISSAIARSRFIQRTRRAGCALSVLACRIRASHR